jgi:hypothetical protein
MYVSFSLSLSCLKSCHLRIKVPNTNLVWSVPAVSPLRAKVGFVVGYNQSSLFTHGAEQITLAEAQDNNTFQQWSFTTIV